MEKENLVMIQLIKHPLKRKASLGRMYDEGCFKQKITTNTEAIDYKTADKTFIDLFKKLDAENPNTFVVQKYNKLWTIIHKQNYEVLAYNLTHMY